MAIKKMFLYTVLAFGVCQLISLSGDVLVLLASKIGGVFSIWTLPGSKIQLPLAVVAISDFTVGWIIALKGIIQSLVNRFFHDTYSIATSVIAVAIVEEIQYRGPLRLLLGLGRKIPWLVFVLLAFGVNIMFMLPHAGSALVFLFSIAGFAACASWLVWKTEKLWPAMVLHGLFNLYWVFGKVTTARLQLF